MRTRLLLAVAALLALPACLDPIVGTQCATGYSPCGGKCVPTGSCATHDAGQVADGGDATLLDASPGEPESDVDAETMESGPATDAQSASDGAEVGFYDGGRQEDLLEPDIDAEAGNPSLDGPEGAPSDTKTVNSGDGGTPAVAIDGASGADDRDGGSVWAETMQSQQTTRPQQTTQSQMTVAKMIPRCFVSAVPMPRIAQATRQVLSCWARMPRITGMAPATGPVSCLPTMVGLGTPATLAQPLRTRAERLRMGLYRTPARCSVRSNGRSAATSA